MELVVVQKYATPVDAELAQAALDSIGIESAVRSNGVGVEVLVQSGDLAAAKDILGVEGIEDEDPRRPGVP